MRVCVCVCAISRFLHSFVAIATMQGAAGPPQEEDYKCGGELRSTTSGTEGGPVADVIKIFVFHYFPAADAIKFC